MLIEGCADESRDPADAAEIITRYLGQVDQARLAESLANRPDEADRDQTLDRDGAVGSDVPSQQLVRRPVLEASEHRRELFDQPIDVKRIDPRRVNDNGYATRARWRSCGRELEERGACVLSHDTYCRIFRHRRQVPVQSWCV
jgi:hypothetical protein